MSPATPHVHAAIPHDAAAVLGRFARTEFGLADAPRGLVDNTRIVFRHLQSAEDVADVVRLRDEIALPESVLAQPGFAALEKKETPWASSARSTWTA